MIRSACPLLVRHIVASVSAGETSRGGGGGGLDHRRGGGGAMNVFDRHTKRLQKARAAVAEDAHLYDYLKDHVREEERGCELVQILIRVFLCVIT